MHVLTWPHKPSYEEAALAAPSPGVTSHQYLQRPPLCGNICPRASGGGPGVSRPRTKPGCQPRICRRSLIPHLHTSLPDFYENLLPRCPPPYEHGTIVCSACGMFIEFESNYLTHLLVREDFKKKEKIIKPF